MERFTNGSKLKIPSKHCRRRCPRLVFIASQLVLLAILLSVLIPTNAQQQQDDPLPSDDSQNTATPDNADAASESIHTDTVEDSMFDPLAMDPSCGNDADGDCYAPPESTIETTTKIDATCFKGGDDPDADDIKDAELSSSNEEMVCNADGEKLVVDKHWGSDPRTLKMRDTLRFLGTGWSSLAVEIAANTSKVKNGAFIDIETGAAAATTAKADTKESKSQKLQQQQQQTNNHRPPIFLIPGLASTRLVAWRHKKCFASDIKVQDNVWLNLNLIIRMGTVDLRCMQECLRLGLNQTDTDDPAGGCKLRPDEGLDAIASLSPGGIGSSIMIGGTNTVYAWLIQWLADNLGYDVGNVI